MSAKWKLALLLPPISVFVIWMNSARPYNLSKIKRIKGSPIGAGHTVSVELLPGRILIEQYNFRRTGIVVPVQIRPDFKEVVFGTSTFELGAWNTHYSWLHPFFRREVAIQIPFLWIFLILCAVSLILVGLGRRTT